MRYNDGSKSKGENRMTHEMFRDTVKAFRRSLRRCRIAITALLLLIAGLCLYIFLKLTG